MSWNRTAFAVNEGIIFTLIFTTAGVWIIGCAWLIGGMSYVECILGIQTFSSAIVGLLGFMFLSFVMFTILNFCLGE